jgi:membrane fusion protein, multidrug efflux system
MRIRLRPITLLGIAVASWAALAGATSLAAPKAETAPGRNPAAQVLPVETRILERVSAYEVGEEFAGRVVAGRQSSLGFERDGIVTAMAVDEGDKVEKGDILARLGTAILEARRRELNAQLAQTQATYEEVEARLDYARATVKRRDGLVRNAHVSQQSYDEALFDERALTAKLKATEAAVAAVRAELGVLQAEMDRSRIVAPFDGTIIARLADEGTAMAAGESLLRLIEDDALEIRIGVSESVADIIETGRVYDIRVGTRTFPAVLRTILPSVDPETRTVQAVFLLAELDGPRPRSGQLAVLTIARRVTAEGFWLPVAALTSGRRGLWNAYVATPDPSEDGVFRIERRDVRIIHSETDRVFVRGTLREGERVVTAGLHRLVPGQAVKLP